MLFICLIIPSKMSFVNRNSNTHCIKIAVQLWWSRGVFNFTIDEFCSIQENKKQPIEDAKSSIGCSAFINQYSLSGQSLPETKCPSAIPAAAERC
jgi:hypothetical protein